MGKKKSRASDDVVLFDVIYEDGTKSSRRRVLAADLPEPGDDAYAKTVIMAQDRQISAKSGHDRGSIRSIVRSAV